MMSSHLTGTAGESAAADYLQNQGLRIIERNFRVRGGEIDLICRDGAVIVFVEVRVRASETYGSAAESITLTKQRRLIFAARHWLGRHGEMPCRFDCVLISGTALEWLRGAFTAD